MRDRPLLSDLLTALPAMLQAMSQRVLRALIALVARVAGLSRDLAKAVSRFLVRVSKWVWHLYCRLELSIIDALSFLLITVWSLRLLALLLAPAVLLAIFHYWIAAAAYVVVLGIAIWRFYMVKDGEVEAAAEEQAPIRVFLNKLLGWSLRVILLALTFVTTAVLFSPSSTETMTLLNEQWSRLHSLSLGSLSGTPDAPSSRGSLSKSPSPSTDTETETIGVGGLLVLLFLIGLVALFLRAIWKFIPASNEEGTSTSESGSETRHARPTGSDEA